MSQKWPSRRFYIVLPLSVSVAYVSCAFNPTVCFPSVCDDLSIHLILQRHGCNGERQVYRASSSPLF